MFQKHIFGFSFVNIVYVQTYLLGCTIAAIYGGQRLLNEGLKFQRIISKLTNTLTTDAPSPVADAVTKLQLFVKINPIRIEYTKKLVLKMHLVPIILSLSATYIITILQFTHVI
ncbi:hypothetical protein HW555_008850 [Spodoptera exigua]|uniref:Gustatory receptor n=1 Tax=Spodoptera exigua TaxID=7107 RepID=A0A835GAD1_SPOEX|nr:hypothetical protein HW555_008850 [Spodoptera exigua]